MEVTKIKLLRVLDILKETDEDHPITTNQILEQLKLYGISAERKAVQRDIIALQNYGYDIVLHEDNKKGYFMASRLFEDWELKVLLDAAIEAYFFTAADSRKFTEKIAALGSRDCRRMLRQVTPIETDLHKGLPMTKNYIDTILKAIRHKKNVGFNYCTIDDDLQDKITHEGRIFKVSPYALIWRRDHYYLVGQNKKYESISYFRLDRMRCLEELDEPAVTAEEFLGPNADLKLKEYINDNLYNFGGSKVYLKLRVKAGRAEVLYDYFPREEVMLLSKDEGSITVGVETVDSEGLYFWLLQYGESVAAAGPEQVVEKMRKKLAAVRAGYEEAALQNKGDGA
ncbi:MAG: WYL domain-containing protein [Clostridia bacterium]|nr:WYL domain-containing protein [Clostridia bacterium]